ncbi:hypothetical protein L6452_40384 [Arctium lappa]|uniref:Uncharacterized protein n=1 Tax=Arctium lappa TaxID=4217 RepID=A0ACB8XL89_ARCLA|nr:hypothetical protein L6452_40384 [Arctium lappa]
MLQAEVQESKLKIREDTEVLVDVSSSVEKPEGEDKRTTELLYVIDIDSDSDLDRAKQRQEKVFQTIEVKVNELFEFSDNKFQEEGGLDSINQLKEQVTNFPEIQPPSEPTVHPPESSSKVETVRTCPNPTD